MLASPLNSGGNRCFIILLACGSLQAGGVTVFAYTPPKIVVPFLSPPILLKFTFKDKFIGTTIFLDSSQECILQTTPLFLESPSNHLLTNPNTQTSLHTCVLAFGAKTRLSPCATPAFHVAVVNAPR